MFDEDLNFFIEETQYGTMQSNEDLIDEINQLDTEDENYHIQLTRLVYLIVTKRPLVTNYARLDRRTAWSKYLKDNNLLNNCLMANLIKTIGKNDSISGNTIINLYEDNYNNTRFFIHYLNSLTDENKVPYLGLALESLSKFIFNHGLKTINDYKKLFSLTETEIVEYINNISNKIGGLKRISGETNTNCNMYNWIATDFNYDKEFVKTADVGYDIGGGFCTPYLSYLFRRELISLDRLDPSIAEETNIKILKPNHTTLESYYNELKHQKWQTFDVFNDHIDDKYESYFITSFGFITSTVAPHKDIIINNPSYQSLHTTYFGIKTITELIAKNKDVYFFFYGRPTGRIYQNKIVSMKFVKKKLETYNFYEDKYSSKTERNFGLTRIMMV